MAYKRSVRLTISDRAAMVLITELKVEFDVERTMSVDDNTATISVYNLSENTAKMLCTQGNVVQLQAGYLDETVNTIFWGDVVEGSIKHSGTESVATVKCEDGRKGNVTSRVSLSFDVGTPASTIASQAAAALGYPVTMLASPTSTYTHGYSYIGMAADCLRDVLNKDGLCYTIQNQVLYIHKQDEDNLPLPAKMLSPQTGLITLPEKLSEKVEGDDVQAMPKSRWKFEAMLFPELQCGAVCVVQSTSFSGSIVIQKVNYSGDNFDGDFKCVVEGIEQ